MIGDTEWNGEDSEARVAAGRWTPGAEFESQGCVSHGGTLGDVRMTTALPARCPAPVAPFPLPRQRRAETLSLPITGTFSVPVDT